MWGFFIIYNSFLFLSSISFVENSLFLTLKLPAFKRLEALYHNSVISDEPIKSIN
ncbi:hypothetical protein RCH18_002672 [Flavobacterium sp. PL11]|nr:hypothetical protein [Flavobacterium sp. PL11]